jgi:hypothetical protein
MSYWNKRRFDWKILTGWICFTQFLLEDSYRLDISYWNILIGWICLTEIKDDSDWTILTWLDISYWNNKPDKFLL